MISAREILSREKRPETAEKIARSYDEFVAEPVDELSRMFYQGSMDARAVRTRAYTAIDMAKAHFAERGLEGRKLTSASLACGAAGPVYELVHDLEAAGAELEKVTLVDKDVMALASAHSLAKGAGVEDRIDVQRRDLLAEPLTDYIEPHSVDVVDLLGLFEYIPEDETFGPMASTLLENVKEIVKPGGMIIFGNMVADRPHQKFFSDVVKWPRLQQRTITETLGIIERAGFEPAKVSVRVPAREGVYAVYAIAVDGEQPTEHQDQGDHSEEFPVAA